MNREKIPPMMFSRVEAVELNRAEKNARAHLSAVTQMLGAISKTLDAGARAMAMATDDHDRLAVRAVLFAASDVIGTIRPPMFVVDSTADQIVGRQQVTP